MLAVAIAAGLCIGASLGALGGGGSILTVPALVYLIGLSPHQATTASLLVVGGAAVIGAITHIRSRRVRLRDGIVFGLVGIAGSFGGSLASDIVPANVLLVGFGVLMLVVAGAMMLRERRGRAGQAQLVGPDGQLHPAEDLAAEDLAAEDLAADVRADDALDTTSSGGLTSVSMARSGGRASDAGVGGSAVAGGPPRPSAAVLGQAPRPADAIADPGIRQDDASSDRRTAYRRTAYLRGASGLLGGGSIRHVLLVVAAATGVGLITGFFGVGGGFVVVPALVLVLGFDMPTAVGTSLVVIVVNSASALLSRIGHENLHMNWPVIGLFTGAAVLGTLAGSAVAGRVNPKRLSAAFTILIIAVACYTLARSAPHLL